MNYWNDEVYEKKLQWNIWPFTEVISTLLSFKANNERLNQKILKYRCGKLLKKQTSQQINIKN